MTQSPEPLLSRWSRGLEQQDAAWSSWARYSTRRSGVRWPLGRIARRRRDTQSLLQQLNQGACLYAEEDHQHNHDLIDRQHYQANTEHRCPERANCGNFKKPMNDPV